MPAAGQLVLRVAHHVQTRRYMMAFLHGRLVGFLGWELYGVAAVTIATFSGAVTLTAAEIQVIA